MLNIVSWSIFTISLCIAVLVATIVLFFLNTVTLFFSWEEALVVTALRNSLPVSGESRGYRVVCISFAMYLITYLRFAFLIWRSVRCFHRTFSQINFCYFSGETLSLPSAFVYFAVMNLLVQTACKIFYSRKWSSMLVRETAQFVPQTHEFLLSQPPLNPHGIIWLTQLQPKLLIMDP